MRKACVFDISDDVEQDDSEGVMLRRKGGTPHHGHEMKIKPTYSPVS